MVGRVHSTKSSMGGLPLAWALRARLPLVIGQSWGLVLAGRGEQLARGGPVREFIVLDPLRWHRRQQVVGLELHAAPAAFPFAGFGVRDLDLGVEVFLAFEDVLQVFAGFLPGAVVDRNDGR